MSCCNDKARLLHYRPQGKLLHASKDDQYQKGIHELHDTQSMAEEICRYDLDELDMYWLQYLNDEREQMGRYYYFPYLILYLKRFL